MRRVRIVNKTRGGLLGDRVGVADTMWRRVRGFLGRSRPESGDGILLSPCRAVHMYGVPFPLDVLFLDRHGEVISVYPALSPWKRTSWYRRAMYALELPVGTVQATATAPGDFLTWMPSEVADIANAHAPRVRQDEPAVAIESDNAATVKEGQS